MRQEGARETMAGFDEVLQALDQGLPAAFPTDTVLGLGVAVAPRARAASGEPPSPEALFRLKERDRGKPVAWLVGGADDLDVYGRDVPDYARQLAADHWPGALTLVVRAADAVPRAFRGEDGTIGLRMPDSPVALRLVRELGCPVAATSANRSGEPDVSRPDLVDPRIGCSVPVLDEGFDCKACPASGISSTVVLCTGEQPRILREGSVDLRRPPQ